MQFTLKKNNCVTFRQGQDFCCCYLSYCIEFMSSYFAIQVIICVGKLHEESAFRSWLIEIVIVQCI